MNGGAEPGARFDARVDALLARLVSESGFGMGALSRERLVSYLLSRVPTGDVSKASERVASEHAGSQHVGSERAGSEHAASELAASELAARALVDRAEYARIEALFSPPETWLFRYPESFDFVRARASKPGIAPLRAFLAGCGGWCEPVSIAAALLDAAQATARAVEVVATDRNAVLFAQKPAFSGLAMRGGIPSWAAPFFHAANLHAKGSGVEPEASVLRVIRTRVADVAEAAESAGASGETFDIVAFRNVAIYLDEATRRRAFAALARIVAPEGALLVGHAEIVAAAEATGFVAVEAPGAFALVRPTVTDRAAVSGPIDPRALPRGAVPPSRPPERMRAPSGSVESSRETTRSMPSADTPGPRSSTDPAAFIAAAIACEREGDLAGAERAVGRALYLDRAHEEALVIAARIATARGAHEEAERFRTRAIRAHLAREDGDRRKDSR
ncbi:MAG: CheR family methyltransferase [bacterium]